MARHVLLAFVITFTATVSSTTHAQSIESHGWLNTETLRTRSGDFEFKNGYPVGDTAERLFDLQLVNRATDALCRSELQTGSHVLLLANIQNHARTRTVQYTSRLVPTNRRTDRTGSKRCPDEAGFRFSASTGRHQRILTRPGSWKTSPQLDDR